MNDRSAREATPQANASAVNRRKLFAWCLVLLVAYVATYVLLSRRGYAEADRIETEGFYYFTPEESRAWRWKNYGCVVLFYPLNLIDRGLGLGRVPGAEPMWRLTE